MTTGGADRPGFCHDGRVPPLIASLRMPPITFAHRGASAHAPENTLEAFELALRLGATGLESDVWVTADGVAVLDHDGKVRSGLRRVPIDQVDRRDLPAHIPALAEVFASFGTDFELSLDVKDPAAGIPAIHAAMAADPTMPDRLWLCDGDEDLLVSWKEGSDHVRLVCSTRLSRQKGGPERMGSRLRDVGIHAVNLHHSEWSGGLSTLCHRFGLFAFGWDAQHDRILDALLRMGLDGVYSDHVDRMTEALARHLARPEYGGSSEP